MVTGITMLASCYCEWKDILPSKTNSKEKEV